MALDPYSLCPCGSGKKLKFCCSDLMGDLEKIHKLVESDQPRAARSHLQRLRSAHPRRAALAELQAALELEMQDYEAAELTINNLLELAGESAAAHGLAASLAARQGEPLRAVEYLQDAMERLDKLMPMGVLEAIAYTGRALLSAGDVIAGRGHLLMYAGVAGDRDNPAIELLLRLNLQGDLPLMLREQLTLESPSEATRQREAFGQGLELARSGLWRRAAGQFGNLLETDPDDPAAVYNLAVLQGWLGRRSELVGLLHRYARLDVPLERAAAAEALAQLVSDDQEEVSIDSVRLTHPIVDLDRLVERLDADPRVETYALDLEALDEDDISRPRHTYLLLDKPVPRSGIDLAYDDAPNVLAFLSLYGKRTDSEARLETTTDVDDQFETTMTLLSQLGGDALGAEQQRVVLTKKSASEEALSWRWRLPDDTPPAHRRDLLRQKRREAILHRWTATPQAALGGLSPRDAVSRPEQRAALMGSVLILEQASIDPREKGLFEQLREQLQLPPAPRIDPETVDLASLPIVQVGQLELSKLSTTQLVRQLDRTMLVGGNLAALALGEELVTREDAEDEAMELAYRQLIRAEPDPERGIQWVERAKTWAQSKHKLAGEWVFLGLQLEVERGNGPGVEAALYEIQQKHLEEPGIADATFRLLYAAGLVTSQPGSPDPAPPPRPTQAPPRQRLWTPGSSGETSSAQEKPALWTP
jgi:hypothetical protein